MTKTLGVGVLGLHEGRTLLVAMNRTNHARQDCPGIFYTSLYEELLARPEVEIVAIFTPDQYHGQNIIQAFEAGKHVICTKPLVNSLIDALAVLDARRRYDRKLLVGQSTRFFESFQRQRAACERGELSELEFIDAQYNHRMDWFYEKSSWAANATDWIFMGMSHPIDLVRWYLGPIKSVQAYGSCSSLAKQVQTKSYDIYSVNFRAVDGRIGRAMGHYGLHELPSARNAIELMLYTAPADPVWRSTTTCATCTQPRTELKSKKTCCTASAQLLYNEVHGMHYGEFAE